MTNPDMSKKDARKAAMRELLKNKQQKAAPQEKSPEVQERPVVVPEEEDEEAPKDVKNWDQIVEDEIDSDDSDVDIPHEMLNQIYMDTERDFHKQMRNYDQIKTEDGWDQLIAQNNESADNFKHPLKPRDEDDDTPTRISSSDDPAQPLGGSMILESRQKQNDAYANFCKGFLQGMSGPPKRPAASSTKREKDMSEDEKLDKLISCLDEMGKMKEKDDKLLNDLKERFGDPLEDARARAEGPEFIDESCLRDDEIFGVGI